MQINRLFSIGKLFKSDYSSRPESDKNVKSGLKAWLWAALRNSIYQVVISAAVGLVAVLIILATRSTATAPVMATFTNYFSFLVGIGAILILVSSLTLGLLLYTFQAIKTDQSYLYGRYRDYVSDLRSYLDRLYDDGIIDRSYNAPYREARGVLSLHDYDVFQGPWADEIDEFVQTVHDQLEGKEEFEWAFRSILVGKINNAEEMINALSVNLVIGLR